MFQSTHLHEVWLNIGSASSKVSAFQSTHLHEVWLPLRSILFLSSCCFNPHTYMRCDFICFCVFFSDFVSIHTPTWGVTFKTNLIGSVLSMFQSTHLHEVWQISQINVIITIRFQSTHLHEVWPISKPALCGWFCFNPHTYMRCDNISLFQLQ